MRLRANFRGITDRLSDPDKVNLLHSLISNSNRYYLEEHLRSLDIPGRTRIYKSFGWSYNYSDREEQVDRNLNQRRHVSTILAHSDILAWIEKYCNEYTLGSFLRQAETADINLNGFNIRLEAHRDA
jgi:hypothetical protein